MDKPRVSKIFDIPPTTILKAETIILEVRI